jgi:hypothetical protein
MKNGILEEWNGGIMDSWDLRHFIIPLFNLLLFHYSAIVFMPFIGGFSMRLRKADVINAQPKMAKRDRSRL